MTSSPTKVSWWLAITCFAILVWANFEELESFGSYSDGEFDFLTNPQLSTGDRFYLRTVNGEYVSVCPSCQPIDQNLRNKCRASLCVKPGPVRSSIFTYVPHRDRTFSVMTQQGKYWKRCDNCIERCPGVICADGVNPNLQPAKFELIKLPDQGENVVAIKTDMGRLLELHDCGQTCGRVISSQGVGLSKQFILEKLPPPYEPPQRDRSRKQRWQPPSYAPIVISYDGTG